MDGTNEQIQRIEDKVSQLLKKYNIAQKEVERLQKENSRLHEQIKSYTGQAEMLSKKNDAMKLTAGSLKSNSKSELEKRIDTYLKDIDKCLALLHS